MVAVTGLAPAFSCAQNTRLDYLRPHRDKNSLVETMGVAPITRCVQDSIAATEHAPPFVKNQNPKYDIKFPHSDF